MAKNIKQYTVGKEYLYYFYRFVILPWEIEWKNQKFLLSEGKLREYCQTHNINIKSYESTLKLNEAISTEYEELENSYAGIFWFVRKETKPKDTLRHLRNCFAHGDYVKRQKNKAPCVVLNNIDGGRLKAKGFLPLTKLSGLVRAASSCGV